MLPPYHGDREAPACLGRFLGRGLPICRALALAAGLVCASCGPGARGTTDGEQPRLVLVYATCSLNKNFLSPYTPDIGFTPNLEAFARDAVVFQRHHTETGYSGIAYASIYTGGDALHHGVFYHPKIIPSQVYMLSEAFADNGYDTFFWDAHQMAARELEYAQGVPKAQTYPRMLLWNSPEFIAILRRLQADPDYKALILHNNSVPHFPYAPVKRVQAFGRSYPGEVAGINWNRADESRRLFDDHLRHLQFNFDETVSRLNLSGEDVEQLVAFLDASYKTQVQALDRIFGGVLDTIRAAGLEDSSLIAFTSDHGEILFEEQALFKWSHTMQLSPDVLNVPLIVRSSRHDVRPGAFQPVTRSIDLFPTLAGLAGLELPEHVDIPGTDLTPALVGAEPPPRLRAYSHTAFTPEPTEQALVDEWEGVNLVNRLFPGYEPDLIWVGLRDQDTLAKFRNLDGKNWGMEIFDLAGDSGETTNLYDSTRSDHEELRRELVEYKRALVQAYEQDAALARDEDRLTEEERLERLRALGYVR